MFSQDYAISKSYMLQSQMNQMSSLAVTKKYLNNSNVNLIDQDAMTNQSSRMIKMVSREFDPSVPHTYRTDVVNMQPTYREQDPTV